MRRLPVALVALLMAALAGCSASPPAGTDGDIGDGWASLPAAAQFRPKVGTCYSTNWLEQDGSRDGHVVPCDTTHFAETVFVGEFTGAAAKLPRPPLVLFKESPSTTAQTAVFAECDRQATAYLGRPWYSMDLYIEIAVPTNSAWTAGVRWYRCDLVLYPYNDSSDLDVSRSTSLKTEQVKPVCLRNKNASWPEVVSCADKHNLEFVGGFISSASVPPKDSSDKSWSAILSRCWKLVATYVGVSANEARQWGVRSYMAYNNAYWGSGRRTIRCMVNFGKSMATKSVKGTGGKGVPRWS